MTREEQINKMAKEVAAYLTYDKDIQVAFADVLKKGAQWADDHPDIDVRTMAAWKSGYQAAIDEHPHWISVEDELPKRFVLDPNDSVFVLTYGLHTKVAFYKYDKGEWVGNTEVTHWMPLPQAPKKGGEK